MEIYEWLIIAIPYQMLREFVFPLNFVYESLYLCSNCLFQFNWFWQFYLSLIIWLEIYNQHNLVSFVSYTNLASQR
jgi:hypothetical protein